MKKLIQLVLLVILLCSFINVANAEWVMDSQFIFGNTDEGGSCSNETFLGENTKLVYTSSLADSDGEDGWAESWAIYELGMHWEGGAEATPGWFKYSMETTSTTAIMGNGSGNGSVSLRGTARTYSDLNNKTMYQDVAAVGECNGNWWADWTEVDTETVWGWWDLYDDTNWHDSRHFRVRHEGIFESHTQFIEVGINDTKVKMHFVLYAKTEARCNNVEGEGPLSTISSSWAVTSGDWDISFVLEK